MSSVYPRYFDLDVVFKYILGIIEDGQPLDSREVGGILRREFGISGKDTKYAKRSVFGILSDACRTKREGDLIIYFKDESDLKKYWVRNSLW